MSDEKMSDWRSGKKRKYSRYSKKQKSSSSSSSGILNSKINAAETKSQDIAATTLFSAAGVLTLVNGLTQGADINQHLSRRCCAKKLLIRGVVDNDNAAGLVDAEMLRVLLVYDRQSNNAAPAVGDILQNVNAAGYDNMSFMNVNNNKRFVVLATKKWWADGTPASLAGQISDTTCKEWDIMVPWQKIKGLVQEFTGGSTGTVSDISTGAIYVLTIGVSGKFKFNWRVRYRFCDM